MYIYQRKAINLPPPKQPKVKNLKNQQNERFFFKKQIEEMLIDDFIEKSWKFGFSEYMMIFLYALLVISFLSFSFLHGANNIIITLSVIYVMGFASFSLHRVFEFRDFIKEETRKKLKEKLHQQYKYFYEPTNQIKQT